MDDIIARIIDIEAQAQEIMSEAKAADANLESDIAKETKKMYDDIEKRAVAKTDEIRQIEDGGAEKKIGEIRKKTSADIERLEKKCKELKNGWVDNIVKNIIG